MAIDGSRSSFPTQPDSFLELWDLPYNRVQSAERLTELKMKADINLTHEEEQEIKQLTNELKEFMITPETWNKFQDALYNVQRFFHEEVNEYIEDKQEEWDTYVKNFQYVGHWESGREYEFQNMVTDPDTGDLYLCRENHNSNANNRPTGRGNHVWQRASSKGDKGDIGLNAIYRGDWNSSTQYEVGDAVNHGRVDHYAGLTFIALRDNQGQNPSQNPDDWQLYQQLFVGEENHVAAAPGLHFIEIVE